MQTTSGKKTIRITGWWQAAAAVLLLALGLSALLTRNNTKKPLAVKENKAPAAAPQRIKPGTNTATLTLANGSVITLDDAPEGVVAQTGSAAITKGNGLLSYTANGNTKANENAVNIMHVPRGGQYAVTLSDGTKVWLNSGSSLTYPEVFDGPERKVVLSGEAYFEISKNEQQPFIVHTDRADVHVLGTHFNINAYNDEGVLKTTLLEGAVRLSAAAASVVLAPGEQGLITGSRPGIEKKRVNVSQEVAWKAGYFVFRNNTIRDIMRQISRWYDVEIEYRGELPTGTFGGTYSKEKDLPELLNGLELTGLVHFKIEGRKIIVMT
jgi:ferric-dicitrate binding protein FerR (iron transport regulator)